MADETKNDANDEENEDEEVDDNGTISISSVILLEDLLKDKKYKKFKEALNLPDDLEEKESMELFVDLSKQSLSKKQMLNKALFNFICILAGETISKGGLPVLEQMKQMAVQFAFWYESCKDKSEFRDSLMLYFGLGDNCTWPGHFVEYVSNLRSAVPTAKWLKDNGCTDLHSQLQKDVKFGSVVKAKFESTKRSICNDVNKYWIDASKLPSGVSVLQYLFYVLKMTWPIRAAELAKDWHKSKWQRENVGKYNSKIHTQEIMEKAQSYEMDRTYYPEWWIAFIYLGLPADDKARDCLLSGKACMVQSFQGIRELGQKSTRRSFDAASKDVDSRGMFSTPGSSDPSAGGTSSGGDDKKRRLDVVVSYSNAPSTAGANVSGLIANLEKQMQVLDRMGMDKESDHYQRLLNKLLSTLEEQANMFSSNKDIFEV
jgi:hypothetical protein